MRLMSVRYVLLVSVLGILGGCFGSKTASLPAQMDLQLLQGKESLMPVAVIGSGPAGLMAATYAARGGKRSFVIEGSKPGGLLMDTAEVENWPGHTSIQGSEIIENLRSQATQQGVLFVTGAVERIDCSQWPYRIYTENGDLFHALTIIIATGASPRKLDVPGEDLYWGGGVTACAVCDAPFYKGEEVVVVGGGDSAIEEAIQLASYAKKITILVRKDRMRASARMQARLAAYEAIQVQYNVEVRKILGHKGLVTGVELFNHATKETIIFPTSGIFLAVGHTPNSQLIQGVVARDSQGYIRVEGRTQATSMPGIFAAGDVADFRYRQAGTASGQGIAAGLDAVHFLDDIGFTPEVAQQHTGQFFRVEGSIRSSTLQEAAMLSIKTREELKNLVTKEPLVVIDFWAESCPSCKQMLPIFKAVARDMAGKATFVTVSTDEAPEITQELMVHKIPCLIIFKQGRAETRYTNILTYTELSTLVQEELKKP